MEEKTKKQQRKIKSKNWFFEKINKFGKSLARLMKNKREKTQIINVRNKKEDIPIDPADV